MTPHGNPHCQNCGAELVGRFCHQCSQDREEGTPTFWGWITETFEEFTSVEGRSIQSARTLLLSPGALTVAWRDGHRVRYARPLRLFLFSVLLLILTRALLGSGPGFLADATLGFLTGITGGAEIDSAAVLELADSILRVFALSLAPVVAGVVALFFRGRAFSEHLVFTLHAFAFAILARTFFVTIEAGVMRISGSEAPDDFFRALVLALLIYAFVALRRVYDNSAWMVGLKLVAITAISLVIWIGSAAVIVAHSLDVVVN